VVVNDTGDETSSGVAADGDRLTGGAIDGALGEIDAALAAYGKADVHVTEGDVETICALGLHRVDLVGTHVSVPAEVVAGWARLGAWDDVDRLLHRAGSGLALVQPLLAAVRAPGAPAGLAAHAERIGSPAVRLPVLTALAEVVAEHDPEGGRRLLHDAVQLAEGRTHQAGHARSLATLAAALRARAVDDPEAGTAAEKLDAMVEGTGPKVEAVTVAVAAVRDRDPVAARDMLADAEELAASLQDPAGRAQARTTVAGAQAPLDPMAASRLLVATEPDLAEVDDVGLRDQLTAGLVAVWARNPRIVEDPATLAAVEELAQKIGDPLLRDRARTDVVAALAEAVGAGDAATGSLPSLERIVALAEGVRTPALVGEARVALARAWVTAGTGAPSDDGVAAATAMAGGIGDPEWRARAYAAVASAVSEHGHAGVSEAFARAHGAADRITDPEAQSRALARLATAYAGIDDEAARRLLERAEHVAGHVASPLAVGPVAVKVVTALAQQAPTQPEALAAAEQVAERIADPASRDQARAAVVMAALGVAGDSEAAARGRTVAERIEDPGSRQEVLVALADAAARADSDGLAAADRAEELVDEIDDPVRQARALRLIAAHLAGQASTRLLLSGPPALPDLLPSVGLPELGDPGDLVSPSELPDVAGVPAVPAGVGPAETAGPADRPSLPAGASLAEVPGLGELLWADDLPAPDDDVTEPDEVAEPDGEVGDASASEGGDAAALLDRAEHLASRIADPVQRSSVLAGIGLSLAFGDRTAADRFVERAMAAVEEIRAPLTACTALVELAGVLETSDPARARSLLDAAQRRFDEIEGAAGRDQAAGVLALALARHTAGDIVTMAQVRKLLDTVERVSTRGQILTRLAAAWAPVEPPRSALLLDRAVYEATHADDPHERDMAVTMVVAGLAGLLGEPGVLEAIDKLVDAAAPPTRVRALHLVATVLGHRDPEGAEAMVARAEAEAWQIADPGERGHALAAVASAHSTRAVPVAVPSPAGPAGLDPEGMGLPEGPRLPDDTWRILAQAARDPGFGHPELLVTVVRLGGASAIRIVTDHALDALAGR
jgi:hypothetical protein